MKVIAFAARKDEEQFFYKYAEKFNMDITLVRKNLSLENVHMAEGYNGVAFIGSCDMGRKVLEKLNSFGIKYAASRSIGFDNIDLSAAKELGIKVSNSSYSPYSVAEFAVMAALMLLRNIPVTLKKISDNEFTLKGLMGRELRNQTVGIIGTGRIGKLTAELFKNFGTKVIAYDIFQNQKDIDYVSLKTLFKESDIISLHMPLGKENRHIISQESLNLMKDNVIIINTARGELVNTNDLIESVKNGKIGGVFLDTIENENAVFENKNKEEVGANSMIKELNSLKNVIVTPHQAFYSDQAVSDMVESALTNLDEFERTGDSRNNLIKF